MNTKTGTLLAIAIAAALPFAGGAANTPERVREVAVAPAQGQSDPVQRIIINYREGARARSNSTVAVQSINRALSRSGLSAQALGGGSVSYMRKLATGHDLIKLPAAVDRVTANAIIQQIAASADVLSVEVDEMAYPLAFPVDPPNDPNYQSLQWHFHAADGNTGNIDNIANHGGANVGEAWKLADGKDITVAVIDTGMVEHVDINSAFAADGYDFISDSRISGRDTDDRVSGAWDLGDWTIGHPGAAVLCPARQVWSSWHGTHVAGTVGAQLTNNGIGVAGIAHAAKVVPVRALGHCGGYTSDIADAIVWASGGNVPGVPANPNPAHVINMSLGGGGACTVNSVYGSAIAEALSHGAVVVVSAGNSNDNAGNYSPASCPGAISVAATGINSARAFYSNYGQRVDISAPGGGDGALDTGYVWQAINGSQTTPEPGNDIYGDYIGTSMAAPHVAGIVALMQSARLEAEKALLTPDQVLAYLQETVTPFSVPPTSSEPIGPGIVNAAAAVIRATCEGDDCTPAPPPPPAATPIMNKTPISGLSGGSQDFVLTVPAGAKGPLSIMTGGGSGDLTLYVHEGEAPANNADWARRSARRGNSETVRINVLTPGEYYIRLVGEPRAYSGVTLRAVHK